jgi:DNA modification methylase
MYRGAIEEFLASSLLQRYRRKVQLVFTSPPFPLNHQKRYGNLLGEEYAAWLAALAPRLRELLTPDGSIVLELGNAWEQGHPVMSPLALIALLKFLEIGRFNLCQQFVCYNPARLPSPAQWVNVERIRVKDSYTHLWWMSPTERPKADNRRVLVDYSRAMEQLFEAGRYSSSPRPSGHRIGARTFLRNNAGAIPSNVLRFANTRSKNDGYLAYCRKRGLQPHPARMARGIVEFFIKLLTEPKDLVLDPFAGSNTTGETAEGLKRRWIAVEPVAEYIAGSRGRFRQTAS